MSDNIVGFWRAVLWQYGFGIWCIYVEFSLRELLGNFKSRKLLLRVCVYVRVPGKIKGTNNL